MKRILTAVALLALVVVGVLAMFWLRTPAGTGSAPGEPRAADSASVPTKMIPEGGVPAPADPPTTPDSKSRDSPATAEKPDPPQLGRRPYDTGIRNDQRVQTDEDGKHRVMESIQLAGRLHSPEGSTEEDLETLDQILGFYRSSFHNNPVAGDNQMIMEALTGKNPGDLVVFPPDHPALDAQGQLLDRWGIPYFFHALSGQEMEIFSAGPDGEFNTGDDIQRTYRGGQPLTGIEESTESNGEL